MTLVKTLGTMSQTKLEQKKVLEQHWQGTVLQSTMPALAAQVKHCKLKKAFKDDTYKLTFMVVAVEAQLNVVIVLALKTAGGEQ